MTDLLRNVSRETEERLKIFSEHLVKWNSHINLVSKASLDNLWQRHFEDSAQIYEYGSSGVRRWVDLGSGGGFPGLVVGVLALENNHELDLTLIESDQRKAVFLRTAARKMGVPCRILAERIENVENQHADILSARALSDLDSLLGYADLHLAENGKCLLLKGKSWEQEIRNAKRNWRFRYRPIPSKTSAESVILVISELENVNP